MDTRDAAAVADPERSLDRLKSSQPFVHDSSSDRARISFIGTVITHATVREPRDACPCLGLSACCQAISLAASPASATSVSLVAVLFAIALSTSETMSPRPMATVIFGVQFLRSVLTSANVVTVAV